MAGRTILLLLMLGLLPVPSAAQAPSGSPAGPPWLSKTATYVTAVAGAVALVAGVLGLPLVRLNHKKTKVEIRKLEAEARKLEAEAANSPRMAESREGNVSIGTVASEGQVAVTVATDPRLTAPLLVMLDLVLGLLYVLIADFGLRVAVDIAEPFFKSGFLAYKLVDLLIYPLAVGVLLPVIAEAYRVKRQSLSSTHGAKQRPE